jgi:MFS family permease
VPTLRRSAAEGGEAVTEATRGAVTGGRRRTIAVVATASAALSVGMLPMFLFGALSGSIGPELGFGAAQTGIAVTAYYLAAAISAVPFGRVTERVGSRRALRSGVAVSAVACALAGTLATSWWQFALLLAVAGGVLPFVDTGAARAFSTAVAERRRGLAFGVKEASVPFASMLAGLAVPALAATAGWRTAFVAAAIAGPVAWVALRAAPADAPSRAGVGPATTATGGPAAATPGPATASGAPEPAASSPAPATGSSAAPQPVPSSAQGRPGRPARPPLPRAVPLLAVSFALAGGAAAVAVAFLVPAAVDSGMEPGAAGFALAAASIGSIVARLVAGVVADRSPSATGVLLVLGMALGAAGALLLVAGRPGWPIVVAAALTLTAGWGWTGLGFTALIRVAPDTPASAAGVGLTGLAVGGTVGPLLFGQVVSRSSYAVGWATLAAAFALGAVVAGVTLARAARPSAA